MRYLGKISDPKDLVTKEYVDGSSSGSSALVGLSAGFIKADGNGGLSSVATIDTASIADDAITADKLGDSSVNSAAIANKAVSKSNCASRLNKNVCSANNLFYSPFLLCFIRHIFHVSVRSTSHERFASRMRCTMRYIFDVSPWRHIFYVSH